MSETVVAIASPPGVGAVSLIRLSGPEALSIAAQVVRCKNGLGSQPERYAVFARVVSATEEVLDEVLVTQFYGPRSFTGEDVVEFACHGGVLVTRRVMERLLECGARSADPGEFSRRAFANGKLDLTQAEAIMDLISAQTDLALRAAHEQLQGKLGDQSEAMRQTLIEVAAHVEAYIDFPDEDIDPDTGVALLGRIKGVLDGVGRMLSTAEQGKILREGVRTVICGEPNVGKSSLLNSLLGYDRAIVSDVAGTTRDTVEEVITLEGIPVRLIDTAGVRESGDVVEQRGIERSNEQIELADLILEVVDGSCRGETLLSKEQIAGRHHILVLNKADLGEDACWEGTGGVRVSCEQENGLDGLAKAIAEELSLSQGSWGGHAVAINARHQDCLKRTRQSLEGAYRILENQEGIELASIDLREALDSIGEIAGRVDTEEILGEIFGTFCIGK